MKTLTTILVTALLLTVASTGFAQQSSTVGPTTGTHSDTTEPDSPVPFPFDKKQLARAKLLLSGYQGLPPKKTFERSLDHPKQVLLALALDKKGFDLYRRRALSALGYYADARVERIYVDVLADANTPEAIRHRVMFLLADHFPADALRHLAPYLHDKNLQYRLTAIAAIRRLPGDDATAALRDALKTEKNPVARKRLAQYTQVVR